MTKRMDIAHTPLRGRPVGPGMRAWACAVASLGAIGCASNSASLSHFPSTAKMDFAKIDSLQSARERPHRFFYNCNFENDFLIKLGGSDPDSLRKLVRKSFAANRFNPVKDSGGFLIAERGFTAWEWHTFAVAYFPGAGDPANPASLYLRTEISQDWTCGPNFNRAKPIVDAICRAAKGCLEVKEITDGTKKLVWPVREKNGGLEAEAFPRRRTLKAAAGGDSPKAKLPTGSAP